MKKAGFLITVAGTWITGMAADAWCIPAITMGLAAALAGAMLMGTGIALEERREEEQEITEEKRERIWQTWIRL